MAPIYFANPIRTNNDVIINAMINGDLGYIDTPRQGNIRPEEVFWCADNGCFSNQWVEKRWWNFLQRHANFADSCAFAVAPDVFGNHKETLAKSEMWFSKIRRLGYKVAFVLQDGLILNEIPWDEIDAIFVGGSDEFKIGKCRLTLDGRPKGSILWLDAAREAKARNKWIHIGRVNSRMRYRFSYRVVNANSVDGTYLKYGNTIEAELLPSLLSWIAEAKDYHTGGNDAKVSEAR